VDHGSLLVLRDDVFAKVDRVTARVRSLRHASAYRFTARLYTERRPVCARWRTERLFDSEQTRLVDAATGAVRHAIFQTMETAMNKDQVKGRVKEAKGKVKEVAGKVVGNKTEEAKGKVEKNLGKIQADYGDVKNEIEKD
jgi:uncharacterized protein YjbJ (UPF0337 family)